MDMALEGLAANAFWTRPDAPARGRCRRGGSRSLVGDSGLAHAFVNVLRLSQICRVAALCRPESASAGDGEIWVQHEAGLYRGTRLVESTELRQSGRQLKMGLGKISIGFDR